MYIPLTACKQYCLAAGATQGNIAYTQNVMGKLIRHNYRECCQKNLDNFYKYLEN